MKKKKSSDDKKKLRVEGAGVPASSEDNTIQKTTEEVTPAGVGGSPPADVKAERDKEKEKEKSRPPSRSLAEIQKEAEREAKIPIVVNGDNPPSPTAPPEGGLRKSSARDKPVIAFFEPEGENGFLSSSSLHPMIIDGLTWKSCQHYYHVRFVVCSV